MTSERNCSRIFRKNAENKTRNRKESTLALLKLAATIKIFNFNTCTYPLGGNYLALKIYETNSGKLLTNTDIKNLYDDKFVGTA